MSSLCGPYSGSRSLQYTREIFLCQPFWGLEILWEFFYEHENTIAFCHLCRLGMFTFLYSGGTLIPYRPTTRYHITPPFYHNTVKLSSTKKERNCVLPMCYSNDGVYQFHLITQGGHKMDLSVHITDSHRSSHSDENVLTFVVLFTGPD